MIIHGIFHLTELIEMKNKQMKLSLLRFIILSLVIFIIPGLKAQEFYCQVQVDSRQIQGTDKNVFTTMQTAITEFVNDRQWTSYNFKSNERIECNIVISIKERPSTDQFRGTMTIVASRPVFGSSYTSTLLNYMDKDFNFEYVEFQPMEYQDNSYSSNLTSMLAYYLYMILAFDFDSYSLSGGTPFYEKAEAVVNAAQNSGQTGWSSYEDQRNRYWLVESYLNNNYIGLRKFYYEYHRKGLDIMWEKATDGRTAIGKSLIFLNQVYDQQPGLFALQVLLDAKSDEIVNIFSEGNPKERSDAENIMKEIDPSNTSKYSKMTQ